MGWWPTQVTSMFWIVRQQFRGWGKSSKFSRRKTQKTDHLAIFYPICSSNPWLFHMFILGNRKTWQHGFDYWDVSSLTVVWCFYLSEKKWSEGNGRNENAGHNKSPLWLLLFCWLVQLLYILVLCKTLLFFQYHLKYSIPRP